MGMIGLIIGVFLAALLGLMPYQLGRRLAQLMGAYPDGGLASLAGWVLALLVWGSFVWMKWLGPSLQRRRLRERPVRFRGPPTRSDVLWELTTGGGLWLPWMVMFVAVVIAACALGPPNTPEENPWDNLIDTTP